MDNVVLYCARHGSTELNQANCFRGNADPPLSALGFREANQLAHYAQAIDFSFVVCSAKTRAKQTADTVVVAKKVDGENCHDLTPFPNERLFAWNVGKFSGKPKDKENLDELQNYIDDPDLVVPGGESLNTFRGRVRPLIQEAIETSDEFGCPGLLVVHSSVIHELGEVFHKDHTAALVKPGGLVAVYYSNGKLNVEAIFRPEYGDHSEAS
jgi:broad specificity phosphatase PhoE